MGAEVYLRESDYPQIGSKWAELTTLPRNPEKNIFAT
jgi:hypothetical protein